MTAHRAWIRRAMARTALAVALGALAMIGLARPIWVAGLLGRSEDGSPVSWVILVATWGTVVAATGAGLAWSRARDIAAGRGRREPCRP